MAFNRQTPIVQTPTTIAEVRIELIDRFIVSGYSSEDNYGETLQLASFEVDVLDQNNGKMKTLTGNLVPHLTTAQISGLQSFMDSMRTKAEEEVLPE